jgi:hypothetical protein
MYLTQPFCRLWLGFWRDVRLADSLAAGGSKPLARMLAKGSAFVEKPSGRS